METLAVASPGRRQLAAAALVCAAFIVATVLLMPRAATPMPSVPAFIPLYQSALIVVYAVTTYLMVAHFQHARAPSLLMLGAGNLYTTLIVAVQLLTYPDVAAPGHLLGSGSNTTIWLWTFWHLGPPACALVYAILARRENAAGRLPRGAGHAEHVALVCAGGLAALATLAATAFVGFLPICVEGGNYTRLITTGVGPAVLALTGLALAAVCFASGLRRVLHLWLAVSLVLLICDNAITFAGLARGTVGWFAGRMEALAAGFILLAVYLHQINSLYVRAALYTRAEAIAEEREAARSRLETARDRLAVALDAADMGDWEFDVPTGIFRCREPRDHIFRRGAGAWICGRDDLLAMVVPDDREAVTLALGDTDRDRVDLECRVRRHDDGAERWIALRGRVYRDADGAARMLAGIVMDTTDRRVTDERLRRSERIEALGQLTGGLAHDFNNLLTLILGRTQLLLRRAGDPARVAEIAETIVHAARRGAEITEKLLTFGRRQMTRPETVPVNRLLQDFRPLLDHAASEPRRIVFDLDPDVEPVRVDPGQLEGAVLNLVANARDAMPDGGTITISTSTVRLVAGAIAEAAELPPGRYVRIAIADDGAGMDEATVARVFEPFFTTKDVGKGTGLGLSQVYGFMRQAGGCVLVASKPGHGTTVDLYLPPAESAAPIEPRHDAAPAPATVTGNEMILVVEDDPGVRDTAVAILADMGYRTMVAEHAAAALDTLAGSADIDLLFSDVVMPGRMNGVQLAREARRRRPALKILLASGYATPSVLSQVPADVTLIRKPYAQERLGAQVRLALDRRADAPAAAAPTSALSPGAGAAE